MMKLQCLDVVIGVTATSQTLEDEFRSLYRACMVADASAQADVDLRLHDCNDHYVLVVDGATVAKSESAADIFMHASTEIDRTCVAMSSQSYLMIHASCAAMQARAVLIAGPSSAGKSTLAAALMLAGMDYIGDEIIGIPAGTTEACAFPKAYKLDGRARRLLAQTFGRADLCTDAQNEEILIAPASLGSTRPTGTRVTPALVVVPLLERGATTTVEALSRADVAEILAEQCFNFTSWGTRGLTTAAQLARQCEGVRLRFGDLGEAAATIERLLA